MKSKIKKIMPIILLVIFAIFIIISIILNIKIGIDTGKTFASYALDMIKILPIAFLLIGLFEVWVKKEFIQKCMGDNAGIKGYFFSFILASITLGGVIMALPIAHSLLKKGAKISVVFAYITASVICRVPMAFVESYYLGYMFTFLRLIISLPLVILFSILLEHIAKKNNLLSFENHKD
jgi:uncharacterized membrane protein YraQ (UPF0718 family)